MVNEGYKALHAEPKLTRKRGHNVAKKKNEPQMNLLQSMYEKGYKAGYNDGVLKGKKLILDELQTMMDTKDKKPK